MSAYDEGVVERRYVRPITRSNDKGIEEEESFQKKILLLKVDY